MSEDRYDAFISYSHAADRPLAKALQRHLHRLGRRWYRPAALRVFRDDTTLTASPDLWASIERALAASRTLVLLAGPDAAASPWVDRELQWWQENRSPDTLFIVVTGGEVAWDNDDFDWDRTTALPERLRGWFTAEPLWVDLRGHHDQAELRSDAATVAAAVHGVPKDRLLSEDLQRQRQLVTVLSSLLVVALVAAGLAVWQRGVAIGERDRADEQARVATSRALAAESGNRSGSDPQLASQLAVAAYDMAVTPETKAAVARQFDQDRHVTRYVYRGGDPSRSRVASAALSADGSLLAYVLYGEPYGKADVVLWDPKTNRELGTLPVRAPIRDESGLGVKLSQASVAVDATGKLLAVDDGERVQVWDVPGRKLLRTTGIDNDTKLVMSADGQWIARTVSEDKVHKVRMWRSDTGAEVPGAAGQPLSKEQLGFSADNQLYGMVGERYEGRIWRFDPPAGQWSKTPLPESLDVWDFAVAPASPVVAVSTSEKPLEPGNHMLLWTWNLATGTSVKRNVPLTIGSLAVSDDGQTVLVDADSRVVGVEMSTGLLTELARHRDDVKEFSTTGDASKLVTVDRENDVRLSSRSDGRAQVGATKPGGKKRDTFYALAVGRRGDLAVAARGRGDVELWELPQLRMRRLPMPAESIPLDPQVALSEDSGRAIVVTNGEVTVADTRSGQVLPRPPALAGHKVAQARFGVNGRLLVTTFGRGDNVDDREQVLRVLNLESGTEEQAVPIRVQDFEEGSVLAVSDDGVSLAAITDYSQVTLWRWRGTKYEEVGKINEDSRGANMFYDVALDPAGTRVAYAAGGNGRVVVAEVSAPGQRRVLPVASGDAHVRLAFTSDGSTLVQASHGVGTFGGITLVDPTSGVLLATWLDDRAVAEGQRWVGGADDVIAERGTGNTVLGTSLDGRLTHWQVDIPAMRRKLCEIAGPLPQAERDRYAGGLATGPGCT